MICIPHRRDYFLCLCSPERQPLVAPLLADSPRPVEFVESVEGLLRKGLGWPPLALVLDVPTAIRIGAERMSKFLDLGVSWPVLRCAVADGEARIMCFEPARGESLLTALSAIAAADPQWEHPRYRRRHLRLHIPGRARLRVAGEEDWRLGNLLGISCGGCFVTMTAHAPPVGAPLTVELVDVDKGPAQVHGSVAWSRGWDESVTNPGVGIEFDLDTVDDRVRDYITRSPALEKLISER